jgi:hypothetical protein
MTALYTSDPQQTPSPGIIAELGTLGQETVITEEGLAQLFRRHPSSVKRAVDRGELPPPVRLFGQATWTVGVLIRHIEGRLARAAKEAERMAQKITQLSP